MRLRMLAMLPPPAGEKSRSELLLLESERRRKRGGAVGIKLRGPFARIESRVRWSVSGGTSRTDEVDRRPNLQTKSDQYSVTFE